MCACAQLAELALFPRLCLRRTCTPCADAVEKSYSCACDFNTQMSSQWVVSSL